jgi:hypothetical protein
MHRLSVAGQDLRNGASFALAEGDERHSDEIFSAIRVKEILGHGPRHLVFGDSVGTVVLGDDAAVFDSEGKRIALP